MDVSEQPQSSNKRIGRYELLKQIDRGFLGPLWAARFDHQGTSLAALVRVVEPPPNLHSEVWEALTDAAWTAIDLQVPGVVHCADVVFQGNALALVDDYIEGQPLSNLLRSKGNNDPSFPVGIALRVAIDALNALDELAIGSESLGVDSIHGGVSPDALMVGTDGVTRVLNPLVSAAATGEEFFRTLPERASYVAPEQWLQKAVGQPSDVYAVACVLWELLTRKRLHAGSAANVKRCATTARLPQPLSDARAEVVPPAILEVLKKALAPEPKDRYPTLRAFVESLELCGVKFAAAADVAHFVENMASVRLQEQRAATENSTIAHLTDFFKAERPASVRPPESRDGGAEVPQPKMKLGLALKSKASQRPASAAPVTATAPQTAAKAAVTKAPAASRSVLPTAGKSVLPTAGKSVLPAAATRLKSVAPAVNPVASAAPKAVLPAAPVAPAVLKHVVVPVVAANDATAPAVRPKPATANTTLLGISPAVLQAAIAAEAPRALEIVEVKPPSVAPPPSAAVTVRADAPAVESIYEEEELTVPYDDLLSTGRLVGVVAQRAAAAAEPPPRAPLDAMVSVTPVNRSPSPVATSLPIVELSMPVVPHPAADAAQTVSLMELRAGAGSRAPTPTPIAEPAVLLEPPKKQQWPAVTWFFMGCTASLGLVMLIGVLRPSAEPTPTPQPAATVAAALGATTPPRAAEPTAAPNPTVAAPAASPAVASASATAASSTTGVNSEPIAAPSASSVVSAPSASAPAPQAAKPPAQASAPQAGVPSVASSVAPPTRPQARPKSASKSTGSSKPTGRSKYVPKDL